MILTWENQRRHGKTIHDLIKVKVPVEANEHIRVDAIDYPINHITHAASGHLAKKDTRARRMPAYGVKQIHCI